MNKKFISYILVIAILNLIGCYSSKNIALNELENYKDNNDIIVTTKENKEYVLKRDSTRKYYSDWKFVEDKIEWTERKMAYQKDNPRMGKYTTINTTIERKDILKLGVEEFDVLNTVFLSGGILAAVFLIALATWEDPFNEGTKLW